MGQAKGRARTNAVRVSPGEAWEAETMAEVGGGTSCKGPGCWVGVTFDSQGCGGAQGAVGKRMWLPFWWPQPGGRGREMESSAPG